MTVLNFPASPTVGKTYTANNVIYTWNGKFWAANNAQDLDARFVNVTGDTMTGNLTVPSLNGGQLAGFRNILVNGNLTINQRNVDIAAAATGKYGQDRWKKTAGGMTQIIEEGNFEPSATYTLSGTGVTTQQLTAPASGNWTLPDIPVTARKIQLELGTVATPFEHRPIGTELAMCQRYCQTYRYSTGTNKTWIGLVYNATQAEFYVAGVGMRADPTVTYSNVQIYDSSETPAVTSVGPITAYTNGVSVTINAAPGDPLTQGRAAMIRLNSASDYIQLSAEL